MVYTEKASEQSEVSAKAEENLTYTHSYILYLMNKLVMAAKERADVNFYTKISI